MIRSTRGRAPRASVNSTPTFASAAHEFLQFFGIPSALQRNFSRNRIQLAQVVARELYVSRAQVFFEPVQFRPCPEWATIHGFCAKSGRERIYVVQPIGPVVDDPNLTDKKFAGNPTLSYRSRDLLLVVGEVTNWHGHTPDQIRQMRDGLGRLKAEGAKSLIEVRLSGK